MHLNVSAADFSKLLQHTGRNVIHHYASAEHSEQLCMHLLSGSSVGVLKRCKCLRLQDCRNVEFGELTLLTTSAQFVQSDFYFSTVKLKNISTRNNKRMYTKAVQYAVYNILHVWIGLGCFHAEI